MLIFVEGIDKAGKSTFIRDLNQVTNVPIYRKRVPKGLSLEERHSFFKGVGYALGELHTLFKFDAIIDRSFVSDWVYSNHQARIKPISIWLDWEARQGQPPEIFIVYLHIDVHTFQERIRVSPDEFMNPDDYIRFTELYEEYFKSTTLPHVTISGNVDFAAQVNSLRSWVGASLPNPLKQKALALLESPLDSL